MLYICGLNLKEFGLGCAPLIHFIFQVSKSFELVLIAMQGTSLIHIHSLLQQYEYDYLNMHICMYDLNKMHITLFCELRACVCNQTEAFTKLTL